MASLEPLSAQSAPEECVDAAPTLSQWFSANIEVTDVFPRSADVHASMAQVANVDEQANIRFFKSKGLELELLPRSTPDGKVTHTHTRVVSGGRWKDSECDAKLRGEEGAFQQFLTWFDNHFSGQFAFCEMEVLGDILPTSPSHIE